MSQPKLPALLPGRRACEEILANNPAYTDSDTCLSRLDLTERERESLLITACKRGYLPIVRQLATKYGLALLDKPLQKGQTTALEQAVLGKQPWIIEFLFQQKITPRANSEGQYPIYWVITDEDLELAGFLYSYQQATLKARIAEEDLSPEQTAAYLHVNTTAETPCELAAKLEMTSLFGTLYILEPWDNQLSILRRLIEQFIRNEISPDFFHSCVETFIKYEEKASLHYLSKEGILHNNMIAKTALSQGHIGIINYLLKTISMQDRTSANDIELIVNVHIAPCLVDFIHASIRTNKVDNLKWVVTYTQKNFIDLHIEAGKHQDEIYWTYFSLIADKDALDILKWLVEDQQINFLQPGQKRIIPLYQDYMRALSLFIEKKSENILDWLISNYITEKKNANYIKAFLGLLYDIKTNNLCVNFILKFLPKIILEGAYLNYPFTPHDVLEIKYLSQQDPSFWEYYKDRIKHENDNNIKYRALKLHNKINPESAPHFAFQLGTYGALAKFPSCSSLKSRLSSEPDFKPAAINQRT